MKLGVKEKDIRAFEKYAEKLSEVLNRVREYNPSASGFVNNDSLCLMSGDWHEPYDPDSHCVTSVYMPYLDGGAW